MADYFGIDLGTAQTLIARYTPENVLADQPGSKFELIPIYYENYRYDEQTGAYRSNWPPADKESGGQLIMPSVMLVDERRTGEGDTQVRFLVGEPAQRRAEELGGGGTRFYTNAKADLESDQGPDENGIRAEDVIYQLLRTCFASILNYMDRRDTDLGLNENFKARKRRSARIGVSTPLATNSRFSQVVLDMARQAALSVGFEQVDEIIRLVEEPTAALANYIHSEYRRGDSPIRERIESTGSYSGVAMVIDLGGGTTDVAVRPFVAQKTRTGFGLAFPERHITASGRAVHRADNARASFGGLDFDDRIAAFLASKFNDIYSRENPGEAFLYGDHRNFAADYALQFNPGMRFRRTVDEPTRVRIRGKVTRMARTLKEAFSDPELRRYQLPDIYGLKSATDDFSFQCTVEREEFRQLVLPLLESEQARTFQPNAPAETVEHIVTDTIRRSEASLSDLDFIYLTGGTSMMGDVRGWVRKYADGRCPVIWANDRPSQLSCHNCMTDIVNGIAMFMVKGTGLMEYKQTLANAVMIDTNKGLPKVLIPAGTQCPSSGELRDVIPVDSVVGIGIRLYSGLDEYSPELRILGEYRISRQKVIPPNTTLSFRYSLDIDKQITLTAFYVNETGAYSEAELDLKQLI